MKKNWIACVTLAALLLTGCEAPHLGMETNLTNDVVSAPEVTPAAESQQAENTPVPEVPGVGTVSYSPVKAPSAFADGDGFSAQLYALLAQSVRAGEDTADISALTVTDAQFDGVRSYLLSRNPWGTLTDITKDEAGSVTITYSTQEAQARADEAQAFDDAVTALLADLVPENCSQTAAAIALYKVAAQTIEYDYDAEDGGLYDALVRGKGIDSSYAYVYSFLLDQVGIENVVVFSEDGSHAWNVITLDGQSFHCDPQYESGLDGGQALKFFGLSDASLTSLNGWNTWASENHQLVECPNNLLPDVQLAEFADVDCAGNGVFYTQMNGRTSVFRVDLSDGDVLEVVQAQPTALATLGENVYYLNAEDSMLYRYRASDGDVRQAIEGVPIASIHRRATELHYVTDDAEQNESVISID